MFDLFSRVTSGQSDDAAWLRILAAIERGLPLADQPQTGLDRVFAPLLASACAAPRVVGQIGQSLDGRVATVSGHSHYVNGPAARTHLHRLRAWADAVVVGIGTVLQDDPQLDVRHVQGPSPARVIIDPRGRLPRGARVLRNDGARRVVLRAPATRGGGLSKLGVDVIAVPTGPTGLSPAAIVKTLGERGFGRILIEGGPNTLSRFLAAGAIDRLHVLVAPMLIGSGVPAVVLPAIPTLDHALRPAVRAFSFDDGDVLFDCALSLHQPQPNQFKT